MGAAGSSPGRLWSRQACRGYPDAHDPTRGRQPARRPGVLREGAHHVQDTTIAKMTFEGGRAPRPCTTLWVAGHSRRPDASSTSAVPTTVADQIEPSSARNGKLDTHFNVSGTMKVVVGIDTVAKQLDLSLTFTGPLFGATAPSTEQLAPVSTDIATFGQPTTVFEICPIRHPDRHGQRDREHAAVPEAHTHPPVHPVRRARHHRTVTNARRRRTTACG